MKALDYVAIIIMTITDIQDDIMAILVWLLEVRSRFVALHINTDDWPSLTQVATTPRTTMMLITIVKLDEVPMAMRTRQIDTLPKKVIITIK